jgi:hypothetical protein
LKPERPQPAFQIRVLEYLRIELAIEPSLKSGAPKLGVILRVRSIA